MKRIVLLITAVALTCASANAQSLLKKLGERAKNAAEQNIGNKVEKGVNDVLNGNVGKKDGNKNNNQNNTQTQTVPQAPPATPGKQTQTGSNLNFGRKLTQYSCDVYENDVLAAHQFIDGSMVYNESVKGNSFIIKNNKVYILDAQKKTATVLSLEDAAKTGGGAGMDQQITQWLGSETAVKTEVEKKMLDPEVIDGVECIHYIAYANTAQAATIDGKPVPNTVNSDREVWEHPQWGIALQTLTGQSLKLNYRNIVPGPQPKEKFEIPAGYKETDMTDAFGALMKAMQNQ